MTAPVFTMGRRAVRRELAAAAAAVFLFATCSRLDNPYQDSDNVRLALSAADSVMIYDTLAITLGMNLPRLVDSLRLSVSSTADAVLHADTVFYSEFEVVTYTFVPAVLDTLSVVATAYCSDGKTKQDTRVVAVKGMAVSIVGQPVNVVRTEGETAVFFVRATGAPPPSFQWYCDSVPIAGAVGDTLVVASVSNSMNGQTYWVTLTNGINSAASNKAVLYVTGAVSLWDRFVWGKRVWH
jgi:hypothetical protein